MGWTEDARRLHPQLFTAWREDPANFQVDGVFPVVDLWNNARSAWADILEAQVRALHSKCTYKRNPIMPAASRFQCHRFDL